VLWPKETFNTVRTEATTVRINRCSNIEAVLAENVQEGA
jgi:hypothetical protein